MKDKTSKKPFNNKEEKVAGKPLTVNKVTAEMMNNGIYMQGWISHFVIAPPLIITKEEIDSAIKVFDEALKIADNELKN